VDFFDTDLFTMDDVGSLSDRDLFIQKQSSRHLAIGLMVTVGSQHHLSGLHGHISEVIDETEPGIFAVEINARLKVEKIRGSNLTPRQ
jgi:hypothetical protein